jgi:hypothetical protein
MRGEKGERLQEKVWGKVRGKLEGVRVGVTGLG